MAYDMRDLVETLKKAGELVEVDEELDWNYEISAYEVLSARFNGPAFLFNKVRGSMEGSRVLAGMFAGSFRNPHRRVALALGMDPNMDRLGFLGALAAKMGNMLRPVEVATGPCKEVIKTGKDINLLEFPFTCHALGDGGRYIFSNATTIKDPDSYWINTGNYAIGVYSRNRLVITPYAHTNFVAIYTMKYQARGRSMPVAVCLGGDPAVLLAAGTILPPAVTEYDMAGGLRGTPVEMVKAETSDLLVPAQAEVVIEGEIRPYERLPEGPKIESFGFSVGPRQPFYAIRVHCVTHRKDPIVADIHTAIGGSADSLHQSFLSMGYLATKMMMRMPLRPGFTAGVTVSGSTVNHAVVKRKYPEDYPGFMEDLFNKVLAYPGLGGPVLANQVFCDDDVNLMDRAEWYEALLTQTNPARDVIRSSFKYPIMTIESSWMEEEDRSQYVGPGTIRAPKLLVDATTKEEPPLGVRRMSFETIFPQEVQAWVVENWQRMGFTEQPRWNRGWLEAQI